MSMKTKIKNVDKSIKNKIICLMYANGMDRDTVTYMLNNGTLSDIADYIDIDELTR